MQDEVTIKRLIIVPLKGARTVKIFGDKSNESKLHSGRKQVQIEVTECLLSLGAEFFVYQFAIQDYKD
jgi:hypothetical protein